MSSSIRSGIMAAGLISVGAGGFGCNVNAPIQPDRDPGPRAPAARIVAPTSAFVGEVVTFDGSESSDVDGEIVSHTWNLGEGTQLDGATVMHTYPSAGGYVVSLTVVDDQGLEKRKEHVIEVAEVALRADLIIDPETVHVGEDVTFDARGSIGQHEIVAYRWTFGDGATASGDLVEHAYSSAGTYSILLEVEDATGQIAQQTGSVLVAPIDVGGTWDLAPAGSGQLTYSCQSYNAIYEDTELTITVEDDGTLSAQSQMGRTWTGSVDGSGFTLQTVYIGETGPSCISAPVTATLTGTFTSATGLTASAAVYYDLSSPCQCSALFELDGAKR